MRSSVFAGFVALGVLLVGSSARAQDTAAPAAPTARAAAPPAPAEPPAAPAAPAAPAQAEPEPDPLAPGPGRVPVLVESTRGGPFNVGVGAAMQRNESPARFTSETHGASCRTPCTLYLRPGVRRLFGDAGTDFPWSSDVRIAPGSTHQLHYRGHLLGLSALGGLGFVVGIAGGVGALAVAIISGIVANPRPEPWFYVLLGAGTLAGAGVAFGGFRLLEFAGPRLETRRATPLPALDAGLRVSPAGGSGEAWLALRF